MTPDDKEFFGKKLWFNVSRWTWVRIAFLFMFCISSFGLYGVEKNSQDDINRFQQQSIEQCERGNGVRQVIRDLVVTSYSSGGTIDLSQFSHYATLDPNTKGFIDELNLVLKSSSTPEARTKQINDLLLKVPLVDCPSITR